MIGRVQFLNVVTEILVGPIKMTISHGTLADAEHDAIQAISDLEQTEFIAGQASLSPLLF
jgi:hypothetical protein